MKVLVVGGGGREHALVWKLAQSPKVDQILCAPGNPGIASLAECVEIAASDIESLARLARDREVDLTVVGPEDPLSRGIVDLFEREGLLIFGPAKAAARLESSKAFAKHIMAKYGIPTADYEEFTDADSAAAYIKSIGAPIVIKADGLAAGKGVTVAHTNDEAFAAINTIMRDRIFGDAGSRVVVEECLTGEEASILALSDGVTIVPLLPSQDHKPAFDNDTGPNTGGMGAYSPAPVVDASMLQEITERILKPCIQGMASEGMTYKGVLYAGLMVTSKGPKVIEFNCRFGDPETQVVLPQMKSDLVDAILACCKGTLADVSVEWNQGACVSVVMASGGYPGAYPKNIEIQGIQDAEADSAVRVFHAGTKKVGERLVTNGGRVLNVTAADNSISAAIDRAYAAVKKIRFDKAHFRTDIGRKALQRMTSG